MASSNTSKEIGFYNFGTGLSGILSNVVMYIIGSCLPLPKNDSY